MVLKNNDTYFITPNIMEITKKMKNRNDFIHLIIECIRVCLNHNNYDYNLGTFSFFNTHTSNRLNFSSSWIEESKDSNDQIIIYRFNRIFSFLFPFNISKKIYGKHEIISFSEKAIELNIDEPQLQMVEYFIKRNWFDEKHFIYSMEERYDEFYEYFNNSYDENLDDLIKDKYFVLLNKLNMFEIGYLRYDYDEKYQNGDLHPLNHLDINYSNNSTFKIGLKKEFDEDLFCNLIDRKTNCLFIH